MNKRLFAKLALAASVAVCALGGNSALAETPLKFQLDWRFEGPAAFFTDPLAKGYFKKEGIDLTVDVGNGSGGTVTRVASGAYDIGFADTASLMEFYGNNPDAKNKPVAVFMVYNGFPASVMALKKSGIKQPADLSGKKLGAPIFDSGRRAFPIFAKETGVKDVTWVTMDPALRETMLVRGDIDAITGFTFTSLLNLEARGVKAADVTVMPFDKYGVKFYGNAIIVSPQLLKDKPEVIKAFLRAFAKGAKEVMANPKDAVASVKAHDGIVNSQLEARRLQLAIDSVINTPETRAEGFGQISMPRLSLMASQVSDIFHTKTRVNAADIWNGQFLPTAAELNVLPATK